MTNQLTAKTIYFQVDELSGETYIERYKTLNDANVAALEYWQQLTSGQKKGRCTFVACIDAKGQAECAEYYSDLEGSELINAFEDSNFWSSNDSCFNSSIFDRLEKAEEEASDLYKQAREEAEIAILYAEDEPTDENKELARITTERSKKAEADEDEAYEKLQNYCE